MLYVIIAVLFVYISSQLEFLFKVIINIPCRVLLYLFMVYDLLFLIYH